MLAGKSGAARAPLVISAMIAPNPARVNSPATRSARSSVAITNSAKALRCSGRHCEPGPKLSGKAPGAARLLNRASLPGSLAIYGTKRWRPRYFGVRGGYVRNCWRRTVMPGNLIYYALVLIAVALVAALLGFGGVASTAMGGAHLLIWVAVVVINYRRRVRPHPSSVARPIRGNAVEARRLPPPGLMRSQFVLDAVRQTAPSGFPWTGLFFA